MSNSFYQRNAYNITCSCSQTFTFAVSPKQEEIERINNIKKYMEIHFSSPQHTKISSVIKPYYVCPGNKFYTLDSQEFNRHMDLEHDAKKYVKCFKFITGQQLQCNRCNKTIFNPQDQVNTHKCPKCNCCLNIIKQEIIFCSPIEGKVDQDLLDESYFPLDQLTNACLHLRNKICCPTK